MLYGLSAILNWAQVCALHGTTEMIIGLEKDNSNVQVINYALLTRNKHRLFS